MGSCDANIDDDYVRRFNNYARLAMEKRARNGKVILDFRRWYYVGMKA